MQIIKYPSRSNWPEMLSRPVFRQEDLTRIVRPVLEEVKHKGDKALKQYTERFDGVLLDQIRVSNTEFAEAEKQVSQQLKDAIRQAAANIEKFHKAQALVPQKIETMPGVVCWRKSVAISNVGLYVPGGTAPLFSSILMMAIPAQIAGCQEIVLCSPPDKSGKLHPAILYTASLLGIDTVCKLGGSQAIAAMAYGTESVPKVYKIFGPGNQYVTMAKQLVSQEGIAIDMPAGPSEVAIVADAEAQPAFIAADLLSQAEHGIDSQVLLATCEEGLIERVQQEIDQQMAQLPRAEIAQKAMENSRAFLMNNEDELIDLINEYAPEHLILSVKNDEDMAERIINAGSVFLGHFTPESAGDYASGTNHTLPTNGFATAYSGLSLDSFVKKITFQKLSKEGIQTLGPTVECMAEAEELMAHKNAVSIRLAYLAS